MPKFKLFAGLSGGFGGPHYHGTYDYPNKDEAMKDAYNLAVEEYESYEGYHGILSYEDVREDLQASGYFDDTIDENEIENMIEDAYIEEVEGWITYNAIEVKPGEKETDPYYSDYDEYRRNLSY